MMHIQLERVLNDIMGATGQVIIRAIVAGEPDPVALAQHRNSGCKSSAETSAKALTGIWKAELLFVLQQALVLYAVYGVQIAVCDTQIGQMLAVMESRRTPDAPLPDLPPRKDGSRTKRAKNTPLPETRAQCARVVGVDLVAVMGFAASSVQTILTEIGTAMDRLPTVKHFCFWRGLAPHNDISGGKVLRSRTQKVLNRAAQAFRQAVARSDSAIGAHYRAMRARKGPQQANVATAHKLARIVYHLLKYGEAYEAERAEDYDRKRQERELHAITRRANKLGYTLTQLGEATATFPTEHRQNGGLLTIQPSWQAMTPHQSNPLAILAPWYHTPDQQF